MIPFNIPPVTGKELVYLQEAIESHKICGDGAFTKKCTEWLERHMDGHKVLLTTSGTSALEMAALLCDIQADDEVIMPSFTFCSTADAFILLIDLASFAFAFAFCVLLFFITIPEQFKKEARGSPFAGIAEGFAFLKKEKGILYIILTMALINFFSRLTYENILSPMILARSLGDSIALGTVNACMGIGGIVGGIIISFKKEDRHKVVALFVPAALSFLFGDLMMAFGKNVFWWSLAAVAASLPIPFSMANQHTILYYIV